MNQPQKHASLGIGWAALRPQQTGHPDPDQPMKNAVAQHASKVQVQSALHEDGRKDFVHGIQGFVNVGRRRVA